MNWRIGAVGELAESRFLDFFFLFFMNSRWTSELFFWFLFFILFLLETVLQQHRHGAIVSQARANISFWSDLLPICEFDIGS